MASSRLVTPCSLDLRIETNADAGLPVGVTNPNLSLLYQRYFPATTPPAANHHDTATAWGVDFTTEWRNAGAAYRRQRQVRDDAKAWQSHGALEWFARLSTTAMDKGLFDALRRDRQKRLNSLSGVGVSLATTWRLAIGLACPAPKENSGLVWHPTYGFPVIPSSSIRGIARHCLVEDVGPSRTEGGLDGLLGGHRGLQAAMPTDRTAWPGHLADLLFGAAAGGGEGAARGAVVVHDAWPLEPCRFQVDVMTCHHDNYCRAHGGAVPHDAEDPSPHCFLTIQPDQKFKLWVTPMPGYTSDSLAQEACQFAAELIRRALDTWGVGAKTGSGYGRLRVPSPTPPAAQARRQPADEQRRRGAGPHQGRSAPQRNPQERF